MINRRQFVKDAAALPCLNMAGQAMARSEVPAMKISRIDLFSARYPMTGHFKFFTGPHGSKGRAAIFVKVTAEDGSVGWGQSVPVAKWSDETLETATIALREYFAPNLIGHDLFDFAGSHRVMTKAVANGFSTGMPISRSGIDVALHDLAGRIKKQSLAQLWKRPKGGPLTLSWTLNPRSLDEVDALMEEGRRRGYRHFNIKVAPDPRFDVALATAVRRNAPAAFLWADANGGYDPATALAVAPKLAEAGVDVLEAPIKPNQISGYQALRKLGALPILMDEGVVSPVELGEFIKLGMIDGIAMKHSRCGGLVSAKEQIELILSEGLMWLGSGLTDPDISLAATLGLYGAFGLEKPAALNGPQFLTADVLKKPLEVVKGTMVVPDGPGLGIEVDEEKVRNLAGNKQITIE